MNRTPIQTSQYLIDKFSPYVSGYLGSSMLTNTEYPEIIILNAKNCALICVDEILESAFLEGTIEYWTEVKQELEKL